MQGTEMLESSIGYRFKDALLLTTALTHKSIEHGSHNDRLEFLGDTVLGFLITRTLYQQQADLPGRMTLLRSHLVRSATLAEIAKELELGRYLRFGSSWQEVGGKSWNHVLEDALEALIGAVYLDGGLSAADDVVNNLFSERLKQMSQLPNAKLKPPSTILQEYLQARGLALPKYDTQPDEQGYFTFCVIAELDIKAAGRGPTKEEAKHAAIQAAATELGLL